MRKFFTLMAASVMAFAATQASATNLISANWNSISSDGDIGHLRVGSSWTQEPSSQLSAVDNIFEPEQTVWTHNSLWWDNDPSINPNPVFTTFTLNSAFTFNHFVVQADNNDSYLLQWWDGSAWQTAWNIPAVAGYGLMTRDSGVITPFSTNMLRFSATGGDNYYALSELQGFNSAVPEPNIWALMLIGFGTVATALRRRASGSCTIRFS